MCRCTNFESNPYATVLVPEPADYFASCAATSMCEAKCKAEFRAFDRQLAIEAAAQYSSTRTIQKTVESMLFTELNEDAYTPMNILVSFFAFVSWLFYSTERR